MTGTRHLARVVLLWAGLLWAGLLCAWASALEISGVEVKPGQRVRVWLAPTIAFTGDEVRTPVDIVRGVQESPVVLCIVAGIHGDELTGIESARRFSAPLGASEITGTLVVLPIANLPAFRRTSRYLPDRRDLNRSFPGSDSGTLAARVAASLYDGVVRKCTHLIDLHSGSFHRSNLPHVRGDLAHSEVRRLAISLGLPVLSHRGRRGTLRASAVSDGIPTVLVEAGEAQRLDNGPIDAVVAALGRAAVALGVLRGPAAPSVEPTLLASSRWLRVDDGGLLVRSVQLGDWVCPNQVLAEVIDPLSESQAAVLAPHHGLVIGLAMNQVVMPGYGVVHLAQAQPGSSGSAGLRRCDLDPAAGKVPERRP